MSPTDPILDMSNPVSPLFYPASQTALLLMDYHTQFFDRIQEPQKVLAAAKSLKKWAEANGVLVIHPLVDIQGPIFPSSKGQEHLAAMQTFLASDPSYIPEHPRIAGENPPNEVVVYRPPGIFSALKSVGIEDLLKKPGIKSLVLGGIASTGVILGTARPATDDGYIVTVIEDACADPKPEMHESVLNGILAQAVHIVTASQWEDEWQKAHGS
jgi:nicotinamidase-related amidase